MAGKLEARGNPELVNAEFRSIGDGVISTDVNGNVTALNGVAEALTGWTSSQAQGRPIDDVFRIVHAKTRHPAEIPVQRALREDTVVELANSTMLIAADGTERHIADSCAPIHDATGTVIGAVLVFRDITERQQAEEALRSKRQQLEFVIEGSRLGTWVWNVQTNETVFNARWAAMLGYTLEELASTTIETWTRHTHPDDLHKAKVLLAPCLKGELVDYECELRMRHKDGHWVWMLDRGRGMTRDAEGKPLLMFGTHDNITERKHTEEALRESETRLRAITDSTQDAILVMDPRGTIAYWNPAAETILGYAAEEAIGRDLHQLISFVLKKAGAEVDVAENGQIACDKALAACERGEPFDLILMDMQMPVMDGYEDTGRLRAAGYMGPILSLTAYAMAGDDTKWRDAGCNGYLTKPIDRAVFLPAIAQRLKPPATTAEPPPQVVNQRP